MAVVSLFIPDTSMMWPSLFISKRFRFKFKIW